MKRTLRAQADYRSVLLRNQLTSLVLFESVTTTRAKAKALIAFANHFFSRAKTADLSAKRYAAATLLDNGALKKTFEEVLPRYNDTSTSYVRSYKVMPRKGDAAEMMMVALAKPLQAVAKKAEAAAKKPAKKTSKAQK